MLSVSMTFYTDPLTPNFLKNKHTVISGKSGTKPFMILILQLHISFFAWWIAWKARWFIGIRF
jgi:hypothetical protein